MAKQGGPRQQRQQTTLDEFIVIFLLVFLLINALPSKRDSELMRPWFLMFCVVRLAFTFLLVLPEKQSRE